MKQVVEVADDVAFGDGRLGLIAGPCVIESRDHSLRMAETIASEARARGLPLVFKSSYDKANRTSGTSFRGPGVEEGLRILEEVRETIGVPVLTDVHSVAEVAGVAAAVDILQIPAFLCRQTDLLLSAAATGKPLNVKKGQFLAPWDVQHVVEKVESEGNRQLLLTERGTCFGYNNLIVDFKGFSVLGELGYPVVLDVTHSLQLPGAGKGVTDGERRFAVPLASAGVAAGADALFLEVHNNPDKALSDASTQFPLELFGGLLDRLCRIHEAIEPPLQTGAGVSGSG
jgi:2-dehydro-3-deoxyphosphooctonate aldolase (KDO 8-P synthase)